jgi:magnesium transporter
MTDTVAGYATSIVPRAGAKSRAGDVRGELVGHSFDSALDLAVCDGDGGRLLGLVPIERLLAANEDAELSELMDADVPTVGLDVDREIAGSLLAREGGRSIAVIDSESRFVGLIPPERMVTVLWEEHEEDLARLGGFLSQSSRAREASEEPVGRRLWHRLPWLGLGLAGAMASAGIVASFEEQLRAEVLLAFFVPAVVYMADAVGTQTETVVIRGLGVGVPMRNVVGRELASGLIIGALIAAVFFPFALAIWRDVGVAATVSLALFASTSIATLVAMALPYLLNRLGHDPAFGSGPLATVIQDLLSILIYFAIAVALTG